MQDLWLISGNPNVDARQDWLDRSLELGRLFRAGRVAGGRAGSPPVRPWTRLARLVARLGSAHARATRPEVVAGQTAACQPTCRAA